jgi:anti-sigma factor RsiW
MEFLYGECRPERRAVMETHASGCAACAERLKEWRSCAAELNRWKLPIAEPFAATQTMRFAPLGKWAIAAAILLSTGFLAGQISSSSRSEIASLKSSFLDLSTSVQRNQSTQASNTLAAANDQATRLIAEYSANQEAQRLADQKSVAMVLSALEVRLDALHSELTTVALNTETGFHRTHQNLIALASLSGSSQESEPLNPGSQQ